MGLIDNFIEKIFMLLMQDKRERIEQIIKKGNFNPEVRKELLANIDSLEASMKRLENTLGKK